MYIHNRGLSLTYKALLSVIGLYALALTLGIVHGKFSFFLFNYFTVLSNCLIVLYFIVDLIYVSRHGAGKNWLPGLKSAATMAITVTFLIYHFLLSGTFDMSGSMSLSLFLTHYVVPIMAILDWILFDEKGRMKWYSPLTWAILPLSYFGYAMIAARIGDGIGFGGSRYPYPFIDVDALGLPRVLLTVLILTVVFLALGYFYFAVDSLLARRSRIKQV